MLNGFVFFQLQEDRVRTMEEKLELADQKVAQLSKLPEVQHELTQVENISLQFFISCVTLSNLFI